MNTHYFHCINKTLFLKLKAHFTAKSFQKAVVLHAFIRIIDFLNGFLKIFYSKQTNHENKQISKLSF